MRFIKNRQVYFYDIIESKSTVLDKNYFVMITERKKVFLASFFGMENKIRCNFGNKVSLTNISRLNPNVAGKMNEGPHYFTVPLICKSYCNISHTTSKI